MAKEVVFFNGRKIPTVGLGTWQSSVDELETAVEKALELGYRHIDAAYMYQNEDAIGKVLKKWIDSGRVKREELFIVTKLPPVGNRPEAVEKYLRRSLEALQLNYVDLYLIHVPIGYREKGDELYPRDENGKLLLDESTDHVAVWKAMEAQVDAGRARSIGLSNFNSKQIKRIVKNARIQPANLQVELHLYFQQKELVAFCSAFDITICAYGPLGSPGLADYGKKLGSGIPEIAALVPLEDPVINRIAKKYKKTPAQVLLRHLVQKGLVVIPKSVTPRRIEENFQVFDFSISEEEMEELNSLDRGSKGSIFRAGASFFAGHPEDPFQEPY